MHLNTRGANRWVLLVGRWAVKVPRLDRWQTFLFGLINNINEARLGGCGLAGFCPVRFAVPGGFLIVMPRVETLSYDEFAALDYHGFCDRGTYRIVAEPKPDSFGRLPDGSIVAVDYGWVL